MRRIWSALALLVVAAGALVAQDTDAKTTDMFFAGTVLESTPEKITVSRVVRGKTQKRSFVVTPDTKVEGKLRLKVRVTVRYTTDDDCDTAKSIVVRVAPQPKKP